MSSIHPLDFADCHLILSSGDVVYLSALGLSFVILGSEQAAIDLLEKRPLNYSDRPEFPMHDLYVTRSPRLRSI